MHMVACQRRATPPVPATHPHPETHDIHITRTFVNDGV